jgi:hypothetical protein
MPQLFPPAVDLAAKFVIGGVVLALVGGAWSFYLLNRSSYWTRVDVAVDQPVPFSHQHHVGELGLDCRFCHSAVTTSANAGMPDTQTCMICHSQVWKDSPMLEPVRRSYAENKPLQWNRVNEVPQFVYFDHSIHINKGVGCSTCHGRLDEMPITWKSVDMEMQWCLACHRHPEKYLRPLKDVFKMDWTPSDNPAEAEAVAHARDIQKGHLTDCSACHR